MESGNPDRRLTDALRKIEIFDGLSHEQARKILNICEARRYRAQQTLCWRESLSTEMFILLSGTLEIQMGAAQVGAAEPGECVGEMGVLTGLARSATVIAREDSMTLVIRRSDLERLIDQQPDIGVCILRNVVQILSRRLRESNLRVMSASDLRSGTDESSEAPKGSC